MTIIETPAAPGRRAVKFTPERIEQIRNLVERGTSREEIAEIIGCTVGSLQVTCSRLGISLRRPKPPANGVRLLKRETLATVDKGLAELSKRPTMVLRPAGQAGARIELAIISGSGERQAVELPPELVTDLALTCAFSNIRLADFIARALTSALNVNGTLEKP